MRRLWNNITKGIQLFLFKSMTSLSFLMIAFYFGYIVYYSTVCFDIVRIIAGCLALCVMIHLNKSLQ